MISGFSFTEAECFHLPLYSDVPQKLFCPDKDVILPGDYIQVGIIDKSSMSLINSEEDDLINLPVVDQLNRTFI